ncbi:hypothetical protein GGI25_001664 [Coemansia spiralis]|uniref:Uncharacterized protein n=2 Tax=Coemansia TaxID=4863 RepID=A0A9W8KZB3_9FUNG|nr:hypothetical protein BX070DRAFT_230289 [Coemansia spiralis]KAJ1988106.1 hypothetical protein EDC05_005488 [Coemansia umbellata]KAJ2623904.1 hypothetical protein GGI26_001919 [Coemansia sp. RSA 1358]KAJ2679308.1 hypothetical protein GGI25_001664 [Coemansia spiralis]
MFKALLALALLFAICSAAPLAHSAPSATNLENTFSGWLSGHESTHALATRISDFIRMQLYRDLYNAIIWLTAGIMIGSLTTYVAFKEQEEDNKDSETHPTFVLSEKAVSTAEA